MGEKATLQSISKAGHLVHLERPCAYNRHLKEFLAQIVIDDPINNKWSKLIKLTCVSVSWIIVATFTCNWNWINSWEENLLSGLFILIARHDMVNNQQHLRTFFLKNTYNECMHMGKMGPDGVNISKKSSFSLSSQIRGASGFYE